MVKISHRSALNVWCCSHSCCTVKRVSNTTSMQTAPASLLFSHWHMYLWAQDAKLLCLVCTLEHPQAPVWVRPSGQPDTQWQAKPWADRTNAITPHSPLSALQHKTPPLAIQVSSCVLGEGFKRGNWHSTIKMHYGNVERMDEHVTDLTRIWLRQH